MDKLFEELADNYLLHASIAEQGGHLYDAGDITLDQLHALEAESAQAYQAWNALVADLD
jgi:hypothetical protein